ncbi:hypothetical protein IMZ11_33860 [Microtetraspora sp. AC03309]|uniref:hypothetical protein n=1 Tax=Microtetraspora sp. AC03309 TaxID=2779376 RepID=UPI001E609DCB|nr:hypothetical protein [Microtetraspora sp. AC03309]MCC5580616.1 hypothetical protein [Microtetraspora sp. AC03309]
MTETEQTQLTETEKPEVRSRSTSVTVAEDGAEYTELPGVHITPNRLVAHNMAYWRKVAGYTQDELAKKLNAFYEKSAPWTNASVSAAERSWDGKRVRQFDADVILSLATIFGLPLIAFFLPPEDDGVKQRYLMDLPHGDALTNCTTMWDLIDVLTQTGGSEWAEEEGDEEEYGEELIETLRTLQKVNERYRDRLDAALTFYRREVIEGGAEPTYAQEAWGVPWQEQAERELLEEKLARARQHYEALRQVLGDIGAVQEDLHERLGLAYAERLPEKLARTVVQRFRAGEDVKTIAKSIKKAEWLVEKALIDAREGYLSFSPEERSYVFISHREVRERYEQRTDELKAARAEQGQAALAAQRVEQMAIGPGREGE